MKPEDMLKRLDELSSWIKKELFTGHSLASKARNQEEEDYLCRVWLSTMYAHCDSYLKEVARTYLEFRIKNRSDHFDPKIGWLIFFARENVTNAKHARYIDPISFSHIGHQELIDYTGSEKIFDTRSFNYKSLRFFADWVMQIRFDHRSFEVFCKALKAKRDKIAHGEQTYVDEEECLSLHKKTLDFLESLKSAAIDAAV